MSEITVRPAIEADLPAILAIYNDAVANTTAIWNEHLSDLEGRRVWWLERVRQDFPVLVADHGGVCVGYATYGPFRPNDGYKHSRELSVYVDAAQRGRGIASRLMEALEAHAREQGVHVLVGGLEASNEASLALHTKHGYEQVGHLRQVGRKFDSWLDLVLMQKVLE
ncbi:MAG: N-acetyltransferase [Rhizobiales bacterium]|nr:N-acetyltransferase [Hyphomicrobiales bacterium]MBO6700651.1 N-acetyltransferase [Hyphomicrobiales bacterium]MBO6738187.1 N-acetyltransferase [Hyphomicrobiales bacterium]MBO6913506.1 N-acetyltransferase [Hyphomicrobiales bacterium]MBO6955325.1 N-acetyltransferase [Hyphomicrobiales bacterium]